MGSGRSASSSSPTASGEKRLPVELTPSLAAELAERLGTPLFLTSAETIRTRFRRLREAFPEARVHYAAKANPNPRILQLLRRAGASLETVSLGEVVAGDRAGFEPEEIMYTGVFPSQDELTGILARGIRINANSVSDIERIAEHAGGTHIGIRVNPGTVAGHHPHVVTGGPGAKFGVSLERAQDAFRRAEQLGLTPDGLHTHVGSGLLEPGPLLHASRRLGELARALARDGRDLEYIDVGGGLGVPYRPDETPLELEPLAEGLRAGLPAGPRLLLEPGRYLVAESTVLLARVTSRKEGFVGVDAGMHTLIRPALYGAFHHVSNLSRPEAPRRPVTVVGPICETGDVLARDRTLPDPRAGDLLAFHDVGAYGYSMASRYNSRPLPAEVLVDGTPELIREREDWDDLFGGVPGPPG